MGYMVLNMQSGSNGGSEDDPEDFVDVWYSNLDEQFDKLRRMVQKYPYVAMVCC